MADALAAPAASMAWARRGFAIAAQRFSDVNAVIIAVDDVAYRQGPLLEHVSPLHAVTAMSAVVMTGLAMIGLFYRPAGRVLRAVGWVSIGLVAVYLFNAYVVFIHGE